MTLADRGSQVVLACYIAELMQLKPFSTGDRCLATSLDFTDHFAGSVLAPQVLAYSKSTAGSEQQSSCQESADLHR